MLCILSVTALSPVSQYQGESKPTSDQQCEHQQGQERHTGSNAAPPPNSGLLTDCPFRDRIAGLQFDARGSPETGGASLGSARLSVRIQVRRDAQIFVTRNLTFSITLRQDLVRA